MLLSYSTAYMPQRPFFLQQTEIDYWLSLTAELHLLNINVKFKAQHLSSYVPERVKSFLKLSKQIPNLNSNTDLSTFPQHFSMANASLVQVTIEAPFCFCTS